MINLANDLAVVFVSVRARVDDLSGMARIGPESRLAVGHIESVEVPDEQIADSIVQDLVYGHAFRIDQP